MSTDNAEHIRVLESRDPNSMVRMPLVQLFELARELYVNEKVAFEDNFVFDTNILSVTFDKAYEDTYAYACRVHVTFESFKVFVTRYDLKVTHMSYFADGGDSSMYVCARSQDRDLEWLELVCVIYSSEVPEGEGKLKERFERYSHERGWINENIDQRSV